MRRRFFQRTKIELSFRPLKDALKIQTSKNTGAAPFLKKLGLTIFKAVACRNFQNHCRKHIRMSKGWAFTKLRLHLIYERIELDMLDGLAKNRGFCQLLNHLINCQSILYALFTHAKLKEQQAV